MHITKKLAAAHAKGTPTYSFEYFPPKTAQGVQNLYDRMDRMHSFGPAFIDITWGAGGRMSNLTCEMVKVAQSAYGLETCMHLTCTDMGREKVDKALDQCYKAGCTNILALRGDPPREAEKWEQTDGTAFRYAKDLVKYIKRKYGDHFDIGVAGYPEGCDEETDAKAHIPYLKEKIDAGGTFIVTQMAYNADIFIDWVKKVRAAGIPESVPILPGIMPIQTYDSFMRRCNWTKCDVPKDWLEKLEPVKADDAAVREVGKGLVADFCRRLLDAGVTMHLHFYTMNLAASTRLVLDDLAMTPAVDSHNPDLKPLPNQPPTLRPLLITLTPLQPQMIELVPPRQKTHRLHNRRLHNFLSCKNTPCHGIGTRVGVFCTIGQQFAGGVDGVVGYIFVRAHTLQQCWKQGRVREDFEVGLLVDVAISRTPAVDRVCGFCAIDGGLGVDGQEAAGVQVDEVLP